MLNGDWLNAGYRLMLYENIAQCQWVRRLGFGYNGNSFSILKMEYCYV